MTSRRTIRFIGTAGTSLGLIVATLLAPEPATAAVGEVMEFPIDITNSRPTGLIADQQGAMWVTLKGAGRLAMVGSVGTITVLTISGLPADAGPEGIAVGPDKRVWVTERSGNRVGALTTSNNNYQAYPLPSPDSQPGSITAGPDGAMWFTESAGNRIGRITTDGKVTEYALPASSNPASIVAGPDGALWFTAQTANAIGRITTTGVVTVFPLANAGSQPLGIAVGPDQNLWFTETAGNRIGRITPAGLIAEFALPSAGAQPNQIVSGADGNLWFTETAGNRINRITPAGAITAFSLPQVGSNPIGIASGADGNIWFTQSGGNKVARLLTGVLPTGVLPTATAAPVIAGASTKVGQVLTASNGTWSYQPGSYAYQWQRCASDAATSCINIAGATNSTYSITAADASNRVRVRVTATNLNGPVKDPSASALVLTDGLPVVPPPTPVIGGQSAQIGAGVTATLKAAKFVKRGTMRAYKVRFSTPGIKGKVRITIVDPQGSQVRVVAGGKWVNANGVARRVWRLPYRVAPGLYALKAVFTPVASQATILSVTTLTKPLTVRR